MSIEKLKDSLLSQANAEAHKIELVASAEARKILETERAESAALKAKAKEDAERQVTEQKNERTAWARLESKRIIAEAKEDAVKNCINDVFTSLDSMRRSAEYKQFIKRAAEKAISQLNGAVTLHIVASDKDIVPKSKGVSVVTDLEGLGGVIAESHDGKVRINYSLESIIEMRRDDLRSSIYNKLFGDK